MIRVLEQEACTVRRGPQPADARALREALQRWGLPGQEGPVSDTTLAEDAVEAAEATGEVEHAEEALYVDGLGRVVAACVRDAADVTGLSGVADVPEVGRGPGPWAGRFVFQGRR